MNKIKFVEKYKDLYRRKNGVEISDDIALAQLEKLICLVKAVYSPISIEALKGGRCPSCLKEIRLVDFKDDVSIQECLISSLCQHCQDLTFSKKI